MHAHVFTYWKINNYTANPKMENDKSNRQQRQQRSTHFDVYYSRMSNLIRMSFKSHADPHIVSKFSVKAILQFY